MNKRRKKNKMAKFTITVLPGDGIGTEVVEQGVKALESIGVIA